MANTIKLKRASGSDPGASDLSVGELAIRTSNCKLFSKNDGGSAVGIVAGSADTLTTARTIAGVSFDGSGNISLNNNAITNGAGYIADVVSDTSPQLGGDLDVQSSKITTATSNGNVKIEPNGTGVVEIRGAGSNDGTLQLNCSAQSHGIKLKSPPHSAGASYTLTFPNSIVNNGVLKTNTTGTLSFGLIETANINNDAITTQQIADGTIVNDDINASAAIAGSKLANPISLPDDHKISFGTGSGNNLEIFHESTSNTNEIIAVDGDIHIQCDDFMVINDSTAGRTIYVDEGNSRLELGFDGNHDAYFAGNQVTFLTNVDANAGLDVTGTCTATAFSGPLTGNVTGNASGSSGSCTGNAATATALETARNIGGVSFDGTANINLPGVNTTGNQNTTGNAATATVATNVNVTDESSDTSCNVLFSTSATGTRAVKSGTNLTFNSSNGTLTATSFSGDGSALTGISAGATGGGSDEIFYENGQTVTTDYTITNGKNAMAAGPISINSGVTVTVGAGETLTIV